MKVLTIIFGLWVAIVVGLGFSGIIPISYIAEANASVGEHTHSKAHVFEWDYNSEYNVYCGWRHGFEGISCVNIN